MVGFYPLPIFSIADWLIEKGHQVSFEYLSTEDLNKMLRQFYAELQPKKGDKYSRSAYINIRNGLNRHLNKHPFSRKINIMQDRDFLPANEVFTAVLKELRREGLDKTKHKSVIEAKDIEKMYSTGTIGNHNPVALQRKIFFELSLHFARRGREGLRSLTKSSFAIKTDATGKRFVCQAYHEKEKNHPGISNRETEKNAAMYEQPQDPTTCPVATYEFYLTKLNPQCDSLFQRPKKNYTESGIWYDNVPLGHNKLGDIMKDISKQANLSQIYTNHCVRATTSTALHQAGVSTDRITSITGHKNNDSLKYYISGPSLLQRQESSKILHHYGKQSTQTTEQEVEHPEKITTLANFQKQPENNIVSETNEYNNINIPPMRGIGSLFAGATIGSGSSININFNAGQYNANTQK